VYFALINPQISYVTATSYIGVYDVVTGAFSHMPAMDANDAPQSSQPRQLAASGRAAAFPMTLSGNTWLQYQTNTNKLAAGTAFQTTGTMVSSRLDFGTPGIPKRIRRVEAVHAPLLSTESITLKAYVNGDPFHPAQSPVTAQVTNSAVNSTLTELPLGVDTVGRSMYFAVSLNSDGTTTPDVVRVATEIGGSWTWAFDLDCSSKRRLLQQQGEDQQGITGKDLYYMLRNAYENGTNLTLYLAEGVSYVVVIESVDAQSIAYSDHLQSPVKADQEWLVSVVLKQAE
jgi:hypothetical protein